MNRVFSFPISFETLSLLEKAKFKCRLRAEISFPRSIEYEGKTYYSTGKIETHPVTNLPAIQYQYLNSLI